MGEPPKKISVSLKAETLQILERIQNQQGLHTRTETLAWLIHNWESQQVPQPQCFDAYNLGEILVNSFFQTPNFDTEYQAFGLIQGVWFPRAAGSTTGWLLCDSGCTQIESSLIGDAKDFVRSRPYLSESLNYYNVYPRQPDGKLTLQISFLHNPDITNFDLHPKMLTDCDRFRIRGDVVSVSDDSAVIHVSQNVKPGKTPNIKFDIELSGNLGEAEPGQFWEVYAKRQRYQLEIESATRITVPSALAAMARPR